MYPAEIAHVLSSKTRVFHLIANDQFPTNPLIIMIEIRHGEIFKVRNPIKNIHDKLVDILHREVVTWEFKDSGVDQAGE
jgi:hypothetical protein